MANTNPDNPNCPNCNKSGLAILPVRYAVTPDDVPGALPAPLGSNIKKIKLAHHKYALRILRQGFFYLFYEKHARGSHIKWETYSVSARGTLWKQLSINALNGISDEPTCSRNGHNIPASVIAIEKPEKCGRVWMAFSEHAWSKETFLWFETNEKARDLRMQMFDPARWVSIHSCNHGLEANEANLKEVLEYQDHDAYLGRLPLSKAPELSEANGSFDGSRLQRETTRYQFYRRSAQRKHLLTIMNEIGSNPTNQPHTPVIVALSDAVGITHELAGFYHDVLGWLEKYNHERELELNAMNAIEGLKKALPEKAAADQLYLRNGHESERKRRAELNASRRSEAERFTEPNRSRRLEFCDIIDYWTSKNLFNDEFEMRLTRADKLDEPKRSNEINKVRDQAEKYLANRDKSNDNRLTNARTHAWDKYEKKIDKTTYEAFQRNHEKLVKQAEVILEDRFSDLLAWLESSSLVEALSEFHRDNIRDGVVFNEQVGDAIYGINVSQMGAKKLDAWILDVKPNESNLLWRAVALNQQQTMNELEVALAEAKKHQSERTLASALNWTNYAGKSLKALTDTYKKMNSLVNSNDSASSAKGSRAFGVTLRPVNMSGIDKLLVTAGDRISHAFNVPGLADHASEKIIQHIFSLRAFVSAKDSIELIEAQAKNEELVRSQQLQRLRTARTFLAADTPAIRTAQAETLAKAWEKFKANNSGAATAIKDARLALLVMLIEGINFNKLIADCAMKNDAKSWWNLAASGLSITSNLFDIASAPAKVLFGNAEAWSYQRIKFAGGIFSSMASMIGAVLDIRDASKFFGKGNSTLLILYSLKGGFGIINASLTAATTFTYAAPLIARLTGNQAVGAASRVIGVRAATFIGVRILFMSAGAWITAIVFGIQIFIWVVSDDSLEEWCSLCAFGYHRASKGAHRSAKSQTYALEQALLEIGL